VILVSTNVVRNCLVYGSETWPMGAEHEVKFVRPRWPYDMRPSVRAEKYIRDAGP